MPALPWDDLDVFVDDFGFETTVDGRTGSFKTIIEEQYLSADLGSYTMDTANPWGSTPLGNVVGLKKRQRITIAGIAFWLTEDPKPDGTGFATIQLARSAADIR